MNKKIIALVILLNIPSCNREEISTRESFLETPIEKIDETGLRITIFKGTKENPRIYRIGNETNPVHYVEEKDFRNRNNFILPKGYTFDPRQKAVYFVNLNSIKF